MSKFLSKGKQIGLTYSLCQDVWQNPNGENRSQVKLIVNGFTFTEKSSKKNEEQSETENDTSQDDDLDNFELDDDEVPF
jgi:single-stranded DNA-binding protein